MTGMVLIKHQLLFCQRIPRRKFSAKDARIVLQEVRTERSPKQPTTESDVQSPRTKAIYDGSSIVDAVQDDEDAESVVGTRVTLELKEDRE